MPVEIEGLILAGGRSRRFGTDKVLYPVEGVPMLARVYEAVREVTPRVWISVAEERGDLPLTIPQIVDLHHGCGPLAGIHAGMSSTTAPALLVVAVDLPYIRSDVLRQLCSASGEFSAPVVSRTPDGRLQPLCAIYPRSLLPFVETRLAEGRLSLHALLEACDGLIVVEVPADPLRNVNYPVQAGSDPDS